VTDAGHAGTELLSRGVESVAAPIDGGAPKAAAVVWAKNSRVQEHGKDLSLTLRRERTERRCRVMMSEEHRVVRLD